MAKQPRPHSSITTIRLFKAEAVAVLKRGNPEAAKDLKVEWKHTFHGTFPTGAKGFCGHFVASAPGFRTRTVFASLIEGDGWMVR